MNKPHLDVITIGRSSVDLYGAQVGGRLEDMASFSKAVGGIVTLPCEERERTTPQRFLSGRDDLVPRTHRRGA